MEKLNAERTQHEERADELQAPMYALLNHIPALSFYKDVTNGKYVACNQAFAEFAGQKTPTEAVGLTDHDIFDKEMADHFVATDRIALAMDEPYNYFEDARDATGDSRQFQTTKLKFIDETGRLCLLGMSMDVTKFMKVKREGEQAKVAYQEALSASAIYESIVDAMAGDYFDLFYVDMETDDYIEYGSRSERGQRAVERRGTNFFEECQKNAASIMYEEDLERVTATLTKENLRREVKEHGSYTHHYRLMIDGNPTYVSMKATRIPGDDRHVIMGVSNVDAQVRDRMAAERAEEERKAYLRLSALTGNLIVLYFVDPETEQFTEFSSSKGYEELGIAKQGTDFFQTTYENGLRTVYPDDQALFHAQVTKQNILSTIERDGVFALVYRLMIGGQPTYVRLQVAKVVEDGKELLIIGLMDEDARVRREQEHARDLSAARKMATVDSLTGIKNKHAYVQWEEKINARIQTGEQEPFAVVVCDINDLKAVNDLYGHKEGDACIKNACAKICGIFSHSPVFRIGGDEFAVILSGGDYERRARLMAQINAVPSDRSKIRIGETISAGMVEYQKDRHTSVVSVFEEADKAMYERKSYLKATYLSREDGAGDGTGNGDQMPEVVPVIDVRKRILIADDIETNREILGDLLQEDYDIVYACDGVETLEVLRGHKGEIALVLLDLYMPNMTGRDVLAEMQVDEDLMSIPVVVLTVDEKAELDCLKIGAMDFIPKPYPDIEIVKARIAKCIELSEYRELILHTECDKLTGLLNRDYFFRYASRLDHIYQGSSLDAVVCDVNRFRSVNKLYGRQFGDHVLRSIGAGVRKLARRTGGIGCRREGDTFLLYCPHRDDYEQLLRECMSDLFADTETAEKIDLRFGVFADAQREEDIEERFACAKVAADGVRDDSHSLCGYYDAMA